MVNVHGIILKPNTQYKKKKRRRQAIERLYMNHLNQNLFLLLESVSLEAISHKVATQYITYCFCDLKQVIILQYKHSKCKHINALSSMMCTGARSIIGK